MYKTIRHGENSLQYTILPQNDDFRIDGKITGNGSACGHKMKRGKKRSFFAYLGLLFVCTVIVGAILVPFLVSAECLPNPSAWFLRSKISLLNGGQVSIPDNKTESTIKAYPISNKIVDSTEQPTTVQNDDAATSDNIFTIPILSDKIGASDVVNRVVVRTESAVVVDHSITEGPQITAKTTEVPPMVEITDANVKDIVESFRTSSDVPVTKTTTSAPTSPPTTSKKPIIFPVLAKTNSIVRENGKVIEATPTGSVNWIRLHLPPIDFQWEGYKTAIILPAILGLTLIGTALLASICLVSRSRKSLTSTKKRNAEDIEGASEDNTTLLTTGNLSDDD